MWNKSISLPVSKTTIQDSEGFEKEKWTYLEHVPARFKDATRQDKLLGNQAGYDADVVAEIAECAYNGGSFFVDESTGDVYDINNTFHPEKSRFVQLTGTRREHGKI